VLAAGSCVVLLVTAVAGGSALRRDHEAFAVALRSRGAGDGLLCTLLVGEAALAVTFGVVSGLGAGAAISAVLAEVTARSGAALVLVSHDPRASVAADRVVRIRDGRLGETWRPVRGGTRPVRELLVVDERGWVRIPERLWPAAGTGGPSQEVMADRTADGAGVVLTPPASSRGDDSGAPGPGDGGPRGLRGRGPACMITKRARRSGR
jgi:hypothetical protein